MLLGIIAEADSKSYFFLPFTLSFSLPKGDRGLSFMDRSNMLAVRLLRVNWMLTRISPRSFSFFPGLECSLCHLEPERKEKERPVCHFHEPLASKTSRRMLLGGSQHKHPRSHLRLESGTSTGVSHGDQSPP